VSVARSSLDKSERRRYAENFVTETWRSGTLKAEVGRHEATIEVLTPDSSAGNGR